MNSPIELHVRLAHIARDLANLYFDAFRSHSEDARTAMIGRRDDVQRQHEAVAQEFLLKGGAEQRAMNHHVSEIRRLRNERPARTR